MLEQVQVRRSEVAQKLLKVKSDEENWDNQIAEQNERLTAIDAEIEKLLSQAESLEEEVKTGKRRDPPFKQKLKPHGTGLPHGPHKAGILKESGGAL